MLYCVYKTEKTQESKKLLITCKQTCKKTIQQVAVRGGKGRSLTIACSKHARTVIPKKKKKIQKWKKKISFEIIHTKLRSAQKSYKIKGHTHYAVNRKAARACGEALFFAFFAYREEKKMLSLSVYDVENVWVGADWCSA